MRSKRVFEVVGVDWLKGAAALIIGDTLFVPRVDSRELQRRVGQLALRRLLPLLR